MGAEGLDHGTRFMRVRERPRRWFVFTRGEVLWEVMTAPGETTEVGSGALRHALGLTVQSPRNDEQHCRSTAMKLFRDGERETWVQYPYGDTATTADIDARWPTQCP